jgi:hypothetical protein
MEAATCVMPNTNTRSKKSSTKLALRSSVTRRTPQKQLATIVPAIEHNRRPTSLVAHFRVRRPGADSVELLISASDRRGELRRTRGRSGREDVRVR